jgi:hypothetical protein
MEKKFLLNQTELRLLRGKNAYGMKAHRVSLLAIALVTTVFVITLLLRLSVVLYFHSYVVNIYTILSSTTFRAA